MRMKDPDSAAAMIVKIAGNLPDTAGVYRMLDKAGETLYVGKARSLKKRVGSYAHFDRQSVRIQRMLLQTEDMAFVHTHTEAEALLLEANLIKKLKPRYNILLRDDKSFPYLFIGDAHDFPMLVKHRGARTEKGNYYGPFASGLAVNRTLDTLQRAFMLRSCSDNVFKGRTRPCLQYHIRRCTAPCVGKVTREAYALQVGEARTFLDGKEAAVKERLAEEMRLASEAQDYEKAAELRDRIKALATVLAQQDINLASVGDADVFALHKAGSRSCMQVFFFRNGQNFGNRPYFPVHEADDPEDRIMELFLTQFYESRPVPRLVIVSAIPAEKALVEEALRTEIIVPKQGTKRRLLDFALANAKQEFERKALLIVSEEKSLAAVAEVFGLFRLPQRIEVFDNSHAAGTNMTGAMIVAGPEGLRKNAYRKFNIREAAMSDDYGMMREVMQRRFGKKDADEIPDLVLIDGGQGQLNAVYEVLESLNVTTTIVGIAKGPDRNAGRETFFMKGREAFSLPPQSQALHYLQKLRDEAHRFVIGAHRTRRAREMIGSSLDEIPGIGRARKKALLQHFGSAREIAGAGLEDLQKAEGISRETAIKIYMYFHGDTGI